MKPLVLSFLAGLVLAAVGAATRTSVMVFPPAAQAQAAPPLKPVLVLARDVAVGHVLAAKDLQQLSLPAEHLIQSAVPASDRKLVVGRPITEPLRAGDLLLWASFAENTATDACFKAVYPKVKATGVEARDGELARFKKQLGAPLPKPERAPVPKADASSYAEVVAVSADVPAGGVIDKSMLTVRRLPGPLVTASFIPAERLGDIVGARTLVPIQASDPLMWQILDDGARPRRPGSCELAAEAAQNKARESATREGVAAYVLGQEAH